MIREAIGTARAAGASGAILARGDSAYGTSPVVNACIDTGARFSFVLTKNAAVNWPIAGITEDAWTPCTTPARSPTPIPVS